MGVEVIVPLAFFTMVAAIILVPGWLKSRDRQDMQQTVRHAIDKGQQLPPELIEAMTKDVSSKLPSRTRAIRRGIIWLAVAAGIATFGWAVGFEENQAVGPLLGVASIPGFIGLAFVILSFFNKTKAD